MLPKKEDGTDLYDWLKFIKTKNDDEMKILAGKNNKIKKADKKKGELLPKIFLV